MAAKYTEVLGLKYEVDSKQIKDLDAIMATTIKKANKLAEQFRKMGMEEEAAKEAGFNLAEAQNKMTKINKLNSRLAEEEEEARRRLVDLKRVEAITSKTMNAQEKAQLQSAIKAQQAILDAKREGRKEEINYLDEISEKEKSMEEEREASAERAEKFKRQRDEIRHNGVFTQAANTLLHPVKNINSAFDSAINKNDTKISNNNAEISEIDKKLAKEGLGSDEREKLETQKAQLQKKNAQMAAGNAKMAAAQAAINTAMSAVKALGNAAKTVFATMGVDLSSIMSEVMSNIKNMLSQTGIASYSTGTSIFTNSAAREQQMKYGLSSSSNYALTQTMEMLNMKSDDDLMYMNATQKEYFNGLMNRYQSWYDQLEASGALESIQEAQLEFSLFKQELSYKLLNWFAQHRDTIFTVLEFTLGHLEFIANMVEQILNIIPSFGSKKIYSSLASDTSDTSLTNSYSNSTKNVNTNTNITVNTTNSQENNDFFQNQLSNMFKQASDEIK